MLDVDQHGEAGNGFAAFNRLQRAGLTDGASALVATPSGGLHAYFTGSGQRCGKLPGHHLDFRAHGGYILAPPSQVGGRPYQVIRHRDAAGGLDWAKVTALLDPQRHAAARAASPCRGGPQPSRHLGRRSSPKATGTTACSGPPAAPPKPATTPSWPRSRPPPGRPGCPSREIAATIASARRAAGRPCEHQAGREAAS